MASYTSSDLIRGVRRLGFLPDACDLTDSDLLEFADEEQVTLISAAIKTEREEHYVTFQDYVLDVGTKTYQIPTRALGRIVRGVTLITTAGISFPCPTIDPVHGWDGIPVTNNSAYCHYIIADQIHFPSRPPPGWTMRVFYLQRPSSLCLTAAATSITSAGSTLTLNLTAASPPFTDTELVDIVKGIVPFECSYVDRLLNDVSANAVGFDPSTPIDPAQIAAPVGPNSRTDWLCPAGMTVFPQVPAEFFPAIEAAVCRRALEAIGDRVGAEVVTNTYEKRLQAAVGITAPRNEEGGRPIVRRNSPLRARGQWGFGRRRW